MYPHFIEVHGWKDDRVVSLNIHNIVSIHPSTDMEHSIINVNHDDGYYTIDESYDELKHLIESSGALINMGDPRLDTKHRLTKEDIKEMQAGEPVWNSNDREWYQIAGWNGQNDFYVTLQSIHKVIRLSEDDLIKFPFYRMKVQNV